MASAEIEAMELAPLTASLGYLLRRLQLSYKKHFNRMAGASGIQPGQVGAMFAIGLNPGIAPSQLCAALGMDAAQVTALLNQLELKKLVTRRSSKQDGRSRVIQLTAAGQREFKIVQELALEVERSFVGEALSEGEARQLIALLSRLLAGVSE